MHECTTGALPARDTFEVSKGQGTADAESVRVPPVLRHPDFFDAFWASNRGSVSKASPILNLSEDIFAGFNVLMRRYAA